MSGEKTKVVIITLAFTLMFSLNIHSSAWHENLGIDNNKAAELYQTKPNDPAIVNYSCPFDINLFRHASQALLGLKKIDSLFNSYCIKCYTKICQRIIINPVKPVCEYKTCFGSDTKMNWRKIIIHYLVFDLSVRGWF